MQKHFILTIPFYSKFVVFKTEVCATIFKSYFHKREAMHTPTFYITLLFILHEANDNICSLDSNIFSLEVCFFLYVWFFSGSASGHGSNF